MPGSVPRAVRGLAQMAGVYGDLLVLVIEAQVRGSLSFLQCLFMTAQRSAARQLPRSYFLGRGLVELLVDLVFRGPARPWQRRQRG